LTLGSLKTYALLVRITLSIIEQKLQSKVQPREVSITSTCRPEERVALLNSLSVSDTPKDRQPLGPGALGRSSLSKGKGAKGLSRRNLAIGERIGYQRDLPHCGGVAARTRM
jgi:hypothetical protein